MTLQEHDEREEEEILEKSGRVFFGEEEGHQEERVRNIKPTETTA